MDKGIPYITLNVSNEEWIKVGDIVVAHDDISRLKWQLAVVKELLRGEDGGA